MIVKAKIKFNDLKEEVTRKKGEQFEVSKTRGEEMIEKGFVIEVEEPKKAKDKK